MSNLALKNMLKPLEKCAVQPYFSNRVQLADLIEWVLRQIGPAQLLVSTFSTSEAFLRRLNRLKKTGLVKGCGPFCDLRAARKTKSLYFFIKSVCDRVCLCENHSKVVILTNSNFCVAIVTSQNQTRGDRYECGIVTTDPYTTASLLKGFREMSLKSVSLDDILDISRNN